MSGVLERTLGILEVLSANAEGMQVSAIAEALDMPTSAAHRLLRELGEHGYVRQLRNQGDYALTIRLAAMGLAFLGKTGVTDIAQPTLDRLAAQSRELVRLSVIDGDSLVWIGVAQGATTGLRYDPGREQGVEVHLASSAGGIAWLSTMSDEDALARVAAQGLVPEHEVGPNAPTTLTDLLASLESTRARGYSVAIDSYLAGMAAMAVPVRRAADGGVIGCLSIAGPAVRLDAARMESFLPMLTEAAEEIGNASEASFFFTRNRAGAAQSETRRRA